MSAKISLSIVVPFLNEELALPILRRRLEGLAGLPEDREIVLVSDGSTDAGVAFVERWAAEDPGSSSSSLRATSAISRPSAPASMRPAGNASRSWTRTCRILPKSSCACMKN